MRIFYCGFKLFDQAFSLRIVFFVLSLVFTVSLCQIRLRDLMNAPRIWHSGATWLEYWSRRRFLEFAITLPPINYSKKWRFILMFHELVELLLNCFPLLAVISSGFQESNFSWVKAKSNNDVIVRDYHGQRHYLTSSDIIWWVQKIEIERCLILLNDLCLYQKRPINFFLKEKSRKTV